MPTFPSILEPSQNGQTQRQSEPSSADTLDTDRSSKTVLKNKFGDFLHALGDTLADFTALEVNTMVVSKITGAKFNPLDAYILIHSISADPQSFFREREIPEALHKRYMYLGQQLKSAYQLHFPEEVSRQALAHPNQELRLPHPRTELETVKSLMRSGPFVRTLRKLSELRAALDGDKPTSEAIDIIYAQTVMQLDGDVINRYDQALLEPNNKANRDFILQIHNQGVEAGERQWRGLIQFMVDLLKPFLG